jgi:hypothetical protein
VYSCTPKNNSGGRLHGERENRAALSEKIMTMTFEEGQGNAVFSKILAKYSTQTPRDNR